MKVTFGSEATGALPKSGRVFAMVVTIAFESHSPGGQRLPEDGQTFSARGNSELHKRRRSSLLLRCRAEANGPCGKRQTGLVFAAPSGDVLLLRFAPWLEAKRTRWREVEKV